MPGGKCSPAHTFDNRALPRSGACRHSWSEHIDGDHHVSHGKGCTLDESSSVPGLEQTLRALASAARSHAPESEEYAAVVFAARSLLFLHAREELDDFRDWLEARPPASSPIHAFPSMAEALGWLEVQPEAATGSFVEVEHETYVISLGPTGTFVLVRSLQHEPVRL
jgi:hypothetical protein